MSRHPVWLPWRVPPRTPLKCLASSPSVTTGVCLPCPNIVNCTACSTKPQQSAECINLCAIHAAAATCCLNILCLSYRTCCSGYYTCSACVSLYKLTSGDDLVGSTQTQKLALCSQFWWLFSANRILHCGSLSASWVLLCMLRADAAWLVSLCLLACRSRQSAITTELIEIISGAAALEG